MHPFVGLFVCLVRGSSRQCVSVGVKSDEK